MTNMKGMTLRFELFVQDPKRSVAFYKDILGFKVVRAGEKYHSLQRDDVVIGIGSADKLVDGHYFRPEVLTDRKGLGVEIVFEVDDINALYEEVRATGYPIYEELIRRKHNLTDFRIVDPDGYYLRPTSRN
ncbi:MAG TPA: VOC family protein [Methylomirabilota bacterium]|nr:VOC family protein [Methylomirabilota bacterium]